MQQQVDTHPAETGADGIPVRDAKLAEIIRRLVPAYRPDLGTQIIDKCCIGSVNSNLNAAGRKPIEKRKETGKNYPDKHAHEKSTIVLDGSWKRFTTLLNPITVESVRC